MTEAIVVVLVSVAAGTVLGLMPGRRAGLLGPIRTFALTAALGVVCFHLFPEAFHALGGWAIAGVLLGLLGPHWLGRLGALAWRARLDGAGRDGDRASDLTLEASYFGLLLHHLGDGVALGAYTGELHAGHSHGDIMAAITAHAVPVVAIMVLAFDSVQGRGSALFRAFGLALASIAGIYFANSIPTAFAETWGGWITAVVSGLLVHVVTHDLLAQSPTTPRARTLDVVVAAAGFATSLIGGSGHHHEDTPETQAHIADALLALALDTAPLLLLGLALGALLQAFGARLPGAPPGSRGVARGVGGDALRGALLGAPRALPSQRVLPLSEALHRRGAAPALVAGFLLAAPELGIETFVLSAHFLGWPLAGVRLGAALLVAFVAALVVGALAPHPSPVDPDGAERPLVDGASATGALGARFLRGFDTLLHQLGAWMVLGVVAAAFVQALVPAGALGGDRPLWWDLLVVSLVAIPGYVCAPAVVPLAAVLIGKGLSPGVALVVLLVGPVTNVLALLFLRRAFGLRAAAAGLGAVVCVSWALAPLVNAWVPARGVATEVADVHGPPSVAVIVLSVLCGAVLLRSIWLSGIRAWLAVLHTDGATGGRKHAHGHHHSHDHHHSHGDNERSSRDARDREPAPEHGGDPVRRASP